jgi:ketosteroid isomerase-like protein
MAKAKAKSSSKKSARKKTSARRTPARKAARKAGSRRSQAGGLEALARKIVRMSQGPAFGAAEIRALYHPDAVSVEATGDQVVGHGGIEEKMKGWEQMTAGMSSKAVNVWIGPTTICIEWDSTVTLRDGRTVQLRETAVHEIVQGKIRRERYYYNPAIFAAAQGGGATSA